MDSKVSGLLVCAIGRTRAQEVSEATQWLLLTHHAHIHINATRCVNPKSQLFPTESARGYNIGHGKGVEIWHGVRTSDRGSKDTIYLMSPAGHPRGAVIRRSANSPIIIGGNKIPREKCSVPKARARRAVAIAPTVPDGSVTVTLLPAVGSSPRQHFPIYVHNARHRAIVGVVIINTPPTTSTLLVHGECLNA